MGAEVLIDPSSPGAANNVETVYKLVSRKRYSTMAEVFAFRPFTVEDLRVLAHTKVLNTKP